MKSGSFVLLGAILFLSLASAASPPTVSEGGDITDSHPEISRPAPQNTLDAAEVEVVRHIGQKEFDSKLTLNDSYTFSYGSISAVVFYDYKLPKDTGQEHAKVVVRFGSSGEISYYEGPKKAHSFSISEEQAIEIAKENGLMRASDAFMGYVFIVSPMIGGPPQYINETDNEQILIDDYVWVIYAKNGEEGSIGSTTLYVDVDTGKVLAKSIDSGARGASSESGNNNVQPIISPNGMAATPSEHNYILYALIAIVVIVAIFTIRYLIKKK